MQVRTKWLLAATACFLALLTTVCYSYYAIGIASYTLSFHTLPAAFNDFRITQIADLHCRQFGTDQQRLLSRVRRTDPDIIVITGDLVDARDFQPEPVLALARGLVTMAPVYIVTGNHEWLCSGWPALEKELSAYGVILLHNRAVALTRPGGRIYLAGTDDPDRFSGHFRERVVVFHQLETTVKDIPPGAFTILLAHRPEKLPVYAEFNIPLALTAHAHGGQVRLPFLGGLVAPHQGFFPRFTAGVYQHERTRMVVSRGLGNALALPRIFNPPELVVVTLKHTPGK